MFYVFDLPALAERAGHAISADSVCLAVRGSLDLFFSNGRDTGTERLDDPSVGLYVQAGVFMRASHFSPDAIFLVLSSQCFADVDYTAEPFFHPSGDSGGPG